MAAQGQASARGDLGPKPTPAVRVYRDFGCGALRDVARSPESGSFESPRSVTLVGSRDDAEGPAQLDRS
jgi:hypothetical protein